MKYKLIGGLTNGIIVRKDRSIIFLPYDPGRQFRTSEEIGEEIKSIIKHAKPIPLIMEGILNKGKIAKIDDRNRTIRAIYQNLRQTYTREQYKFGYLTPRTLIDIISKS